MLARLVFLSSAAAPFIHAQPPARPATPNDTLVSPEVLAGNRVAFRIYAPKAAAVTLRGDFMEGPGAMNLEKDANGVWSVTTGPLVPDFYSYSLNVDGVRTIDPKNALIKQGITSLDNVFFVPGAEAAFEDAKPVPHGEVRMVWYKSSTLDAIRRMHVYTPPGYDGGSARYPVFYLLHGGGDEDSGWSSIGRAGFIIDNLLAANKAKPMIVVMPNGSMPRPPNAPAGPGPGAALAQERFAGELMKDVIPYVESHYRVVADAANRALAGLSMGGGQTLRVGLTNPDMFAYLGVWSAGVNPQTSPDFEKRSAAFLEYPEKTNKAVKLFWIGVGAKDPLAYAGSKNLIELLKRHGIAHEYHESPGGHTWINWRHYLNEFAPLLFR
ncbi:MAG: esterase [Bryobacterales bacterium]|nr:esterase [Bryobacterales bacterium]